ncbi:type III PLP-dependent enzyme [Kribbella sp. CA-293567]|uniref:type III PLP-dependent enzyme n=1 Tax=Kribbella sp. CA-293567 TaxID=3002436 RepID=UPI0022DE8D91|nr:type III PLP-dependent enzyme [Kribbella sp. CA-293567]WBQ08198.1 type III PLP-dependent enzyme [Kribbella sp. CA-293567]
MTAAVREFVAGLDSEAFPAYVYDLAELRSQLEAVRTALPPRVELYYAAKANPEAAVLTAMRGIVDGYEVSSGGELAHVHEVVPEARLAFGGPGKTAAEIALALRTGVHRWHVESVQEIHQLAGALTATPDVTLDILLRVNLPVTAGSLDSVSLAMGGRPSPFGLDPEGADECMRLLSGPLGEQLRLQGINAHLASGLGASEQLLLAEQIVEWSKLFAEHYGHTLNEVNVGGGMAVDYADPGARFDWTAFGAGLEKLLDWHPGLTLRLEPGRALTAYCGWYVTEVLDVKRSHGEDFAVLKGGTHHLRTPATKGHDQPFTVLPVTAWPHPWQRPAARGLVTLTGQLCTPKDVLASRVPVGVIRAADRVLFELAGAYAWNISHHNFLMHPPPTFHFLP